MLILCSIVVSCEGLLSKEASCFIKHLGKKLADKWRRPHSTTMNLLRTRFAINLVKLKSRCVRGACASLDCMSHKFDWEDGAGLRLFQTLA